MGRDRRELQSVSSIYNEDGEPIMSGEAYRLELALDEQAMCESNDPYGDDYYYG